MFNALASLAQRRRALVAAGGVVFFMAAGALGGSVADRLDPYGADDPDTEAVIASDELTELGFRDASVVVLIEDGEIASARGQVWPFCGGEISVHCPPALTVPERTRAAGGCSTGSGSPVNAASSSRAGPATTPSTGSTSPERISSRSPGTTAPTCTGR